MDAVISFHQLAGVKFLQVGHEEEQRTGGCGWDAEHGTANASAAASQTDDFVLPL